MSALLNVNLAVEEYERLLKLARAITDGAPFFMGSSDTFTTLSIEGDVATLTWPEMEGGYYDSYTMEEQSVNFPAELLLMTPVELEHYKLQEKQKYDAAEKIRLETVTRERAEAHKAHELATLAHLQAKYGAKR